MNGDVIDIATALERRAADRNARFRCVECGDRVRPHKKGTTGQAAHFEHLRKNPACSLSTGGSPGRP